MARQWRLAENRKPVRKAPQEKLKSVHDRLIAILDENCVWLWWMVRLQIKTKTCTKEAFIIDERTETNGHRVDIWVVWQDELKISLTTIIGNKCIMHVAPIELKKLWFEAIPSVVRSILSGDYDDLIISRLPLDAICANRIPAKFNSSSEVQKSIEIVYGILLNFLQKKEVKDSEIVVLESQWKPKTCFQIWWNAFGNRPQIDMWTIWEEDNWISIAFNSRGKFIIKYTNESGNPKLFTIDEIPELIASLCLNWLKWINYKIIPEIPDQSWLGEAEWYTKY